jgi:hypothetical protein
MSNPQTVSGSVQIDLGDGVTGSVEAPTASLQKVLDTANLIWKKVRRSNVPESDTAGSDALMLQLQTSHKEFATSYPIPLRWMVQAREYVPDVFEKFLKKCVKPMYKTRELFMAAQGEYLVLLYAHRNPRAKAGRLGRYRDSIVKTLRDDDDKFAEAQEEAKVEVLRVQKEVSAERRQRLVEYLKRCADV